MKSHPILTEPHKEYSIIKNWDTQCILDALKLTTLSKIWDSHWDKNLSFPLSYFYLHATWKESKELRGQKTIYNFSDFSERLPLDTLISKKVLSKYSFENVKDYISLINSKELTEELKKRARARQEDSLVLELQKLDLLKEIEFLSDRLVEKGLLKSEELNLFSRSGNALEVIDKVSTPQVSKTKVEQNTLSPADQKLSDSKTLLPRWLTQGEFLTPQKPIFPLSHSLPSLFFFHLQTNQLSERVYLSQVELKDPPQWIKKLSDFLAPYSITKYISREQIEIINKRPKDVRKIPREYVQWLDPQEKWFYLYLPLITLWFDRFREKYTSSLVTTWEEPEVTFSLTSVDSGESFNFSRAYQKPIFSYEGMPALKIGEDLKLISNLIDKYEKHYEEQSLKELNEEGVFPLAKDSSISSEELEEAIERKKREEKEL